MSTGKYVDGFVLLVPKDKRAEYKKLAQMGHKMWMKHGALDYKECVGDDLDPDTKGAPMKKFQKLTGAREAEEVWFSFVTYTSRKHRDQVNKKVMEEMDKAMEKNKGFEMPFDMRRFTYGGFKVEVGG